MRVRLDSAEMARLLKSDQMRGPLRAEAEKMAERARSSAPVSSGEYRSSIAVEDDTTDRAVARVVAHSGHAALVEAKTGTLKRAIGG